MTRIPSNPNSGFRTKAGKEAKKNRGRPVVVEEHEEDGHGPDRVVRIRGPRPDALAVGSPKYTTLLRNLWKIIIK